MLMELRQLRYFAAVARHSSFTRAAEELHVAQPALSQQVKKLEGELGTELLVRTTRSVELTDAGQVALTRATRVLSEAEALTSEVDEMRGLLRGRVVVGGMMPAGGVDLPGLLLGFKELHPGVDVQLQEGTATEMVDRLRGDEIDVAFAMLEPATSSWCSPWRRPIRSLRGAGFGSRSSTAARSSPSATDRRCGAWSTPPSRAPERRRSGLSRRTTCR